MFKDNKYTKHYNLLIEKAKNRTLPKETYTEKHHIIPRSMGGSNKKENLAHLTAREHFICHWLLVKMTEGPMRHKMINALFFFKAQSPIQQRYSSTITARVYESRSIEYAALVSKRFKGLSKGPMSDETKKKLSVQRQGIPLGPLTEAQEKARAALRGTKWITDGDSMKQVPTDEINYWLSIGWRLGRSPKHIKSIPRSEETKLKLSAIRKGKPWSDQERMLRSGRKFMHKDGVNKHIKIEDIDCYLTNGWTFGKQPRSQEIRLRFSHALKGKPSPLRGRKISEKAAESRKNQVWVHQGSEQTRIKKESLEEWLSLGWVLGRKSKRF